MSNQSWNLSENDFGVLLPYIKDDKITDIDYNGSTLWINDIYNNRRQVTDVNINPSDILNFSIRVSNKANKNFDRVNNVLEAQTNDLRISILNDSIVNTGISVCIRKSPPKIRLTPKLAIETNYCSKELYMFLVNCVKTKMNFVFCGMPQVGKTEGLKLFSQYIEPNQRVITIEDNAELHYHEINPEKDCVEIIVGKLIDYTGAIKASLRQNPNWLMLSEARSVEVLSLIEGWTTGVHGMTTLHTDDTRKIPDRIVNMSQAKNKERIENDVYSYVDIGILTKKVQDDDDDDNTYRRIEQVCLYSREHSRNESILIVDGGKRNNVEIPSSILKRMKEVGIDDPFFNKNVYNEFN